MGAGQLDRLGKGLKACVLLGAGYSVIALLVSVLWGDSLAILFVEEAERAIVAEVQTFLIINTICYFPLALVNIIRFLI